MYGAAILFPGHPYIESATALSNCKYIVNIILQSISAIQLTCIICICRMVDDYYTKCYLIIINITLTHINSGGFKVAYEHACLTMP